MQVVYVENMLAMMVTILTTAQTMAIYQGQRMPEAL